VRRAATGTLDVAIGEGLAGLDGDLPQVQRAQALTAGLTWSSSPTDTPPLVRIRSCAAAAPRRASTVASRLSGTMPRSVTSQPRRCSSARKKRLLL
jgi:hypothetical protein